MSNERKSGFKKNNDKNSIVMMLCTFVLLIVFCLVLALCWIRRRVIR